MPTPARTSTEEIVRTARRILEMEGLDGLTMQRVASAVGVRAPSLYKRLRGRGDLVRLVSENVARELTETVNAVVTGDDPADDLRAIARAFRAFAHAHPQAYALIFAAVPEEWRARPETLVGATEALLRTTAAMAGEGFALPAARTVVAWAHGFVSMELAGAFRMGDSVEDAYAFGIECISAALGLTPGSLTLVNRAP